MSCLPPFAPRWRFGQRRPGGAAALSSQRAGERGAAIGRARSRQDALHWDAAPKAAAMRRVARTADAHAR
ncbi:hypothetical protein, partial [Stutzerimonas zhaodongensis]|uniref:hypothetical protein n=1 Tax=Stutzerimonas zhaodongensis TaxID=1176257 RepID=UPI0019D43B76